MNLGNYVKWLKQYCKTKRISNEKFVDQLILPIVMSEEITNKEGDYLFLDKSRVSNLLRHKDDVPELLRSAANRPNVEERILEGFSKFYHKTIDTSREDELHAEFCNYIANDSISDRLKKYILNDDTCIMLLRLFISALKENNKAAVPENMIVWQRGNNYIRVTDNDLFKMGFYKRNKKNRIIVIPVNTTFETRLTDNPEEDVKPFVSKETIHGQFLSRLYVKKESPTEISKRLKANLKKNYATPKNSDYPIGTIATLKFDNAIFFLLAVSKFDKNNVAHSNKKDIKTAINSLAKYYDEKGQGFDLYIPLIGTGMSRAYLSHQQSYEIIKSTLLSNMDKLQGKINIVVLPDAINEIEL